MVRASRIRFGDKPPLAWFCSAVIVYVFTALGVNEMRAQSVLDSERWAKPTVEYQTYDVISVKPSDSPTEGMQLNMNETSIDARNITLKTLIMSAYGVRQDLVTGLPRWAETQRWDVTAKISAPDPALTHRKLSPDQSRRIAQSKLQSILNTRFRIKVHDDVVMLPIYELVLKKDGPKFQVSQTPEDQRGTSINGYVMDAHGLSMQSFAENLGNMLDRNVADRTGLTGLYDFKLAWTPEDRLDSPKESGLSDPMPSIYTALQEQLGLKLMAARGPVKKLVIDSIAQPSPN